MAVAGMGSGIEAAAAFPRLGIVRIPVADREPTGVDIAVIDVPAFLAGFRIAAAVSSGMRSLKRDVRHQAIVLAVGFGSAKDYRLSWRPTARTILLA